MPELSAGLQDELRALLPPFASPREPGRHDPRVEPVHRAVPAAHRTPGSVGRGRRRRPGAAPAGGRRPATPSRCATPSPDCGRTASSARLRVLGGAARGPHQRRSPPGRRGARASNGPRAPPAPSVTRSGGRAGGERPAPSLRPTTRVGAPTRLDPVAGAEFLARFGVATAASTTCTDAGGGGRRGRYVPRGREDRERRAPHRARRGPRRAGLGRRGPRRGDRPAGHGRVPSSPLLSGVEVAVVALRDPVFGPVVMVGLGGIWIEVLADVAFALAPLDHTDAREIADPAARARPAHRSAWGAAGGPRRAGRRDRRGRRRPCGRRRRHRDRPEPRPRDRESRRRRGLEGDLTCWSSALPAARFVTPDTSEDAHDDIDGDGAPRRPADPRRPHLSPSSAGPRNATAARPLPARGPAGRGHVPVRPRRPRRRRRRAGAARRGGAGGAAGRLQTMCSESTSLADGHFVVDRILDFWETTVAGRCSSATARASVRSVGEMTWPLSGQARRRGPPSPTSRGSTSSCRATPTRPLCLYDLERFSDGEIVLEICAPIPPVFLRPASSSRTPGTRSRTSTSGTDPAPVPADGRVGSAARPRPGERELSPLQHAQPAGARGS